MSQLITPHFSLREIQNASSQVSDTWFKDRPFEFGLRMAAVFSRMELLRINLRKMCRHTGIALTSYLRSKERNLGIGGEETSQHLYAIAVDFAIWDIKYNEVREVTESDLSRTRKLFDYVYEGMGEHTPFIHADLRDTFPYFQPTPGWDSD